MCADPKMRAAFLAELREELAARKSVRTSGSGVRASYLALAAAACAVLIAVW